MDASSERHRVSSHARQTLNALTLHWMLEGGVLKPWDSIGERGDSKHSGPVFAMSPFNGVCHFGGMWGNPTIEQIF